MAREHVTTYLQYQIQMWQPYSLYLVVLQGLIVAPESLQPSLIPRPSLEMVKAWV